MDPTATKARRFARGKQPFDGIAFAIDNAAVEVGFNATQTFAADNEGSDCDQRSRSGIVYRLELTDAKLVALVFPEFGNALHLVVVA